MVSNKIAEGDFKTLDGLVANDVVPTIQKSISVMSLSQREQLAINVEDIYFSFPYQVQVTFEIKLSLILKKKILFISKGWCNVQR